MAHSRQYTQIMNSKRWRDLRAKTLIERPYCERCKVSGRLTPSKAVHHIKPIESGHSYAEYERLAYDPENLQALCHQCHSDVHKEIGSHSKAGQARRQNDRLLRWLHDISGRFDDGGWWLRWRGRFSWRCVRIRKSTLPYERRETPNQKCQTPNPDI